jgi:hypothetical protein
MVSGDTCSSKLSSHRSSGRGLEPDSGVIPERWPTRALLPSTPRRAIALSLSLRDSDTASDLDRGTPGGVDLRPRVAYSNRRPRRRRRLGVSPKSTAQIMLAALALRAVSSAEVRHANHYRPGDRHIPRRSLTLPAPAVIHRPGTRPGLGWVRFRTTTAALIVKQLDHEDVLCRFVGVGEQSTTRHGPEPSGSTRTSPILGSVT